MSRAAQSVPVPGPFGDYVIVTKLNKGGMADVYLAQSVHGERRWLAIKTLLPKLLNPKFVRMFESEGRLSMMLHHDNIVATRQVGVARGVHADVNFIALDYVHGRDLAAVAKHYLKSNARMPLAHALHIARSVLEALDYAHNLRDSSGVPLNLVNRDVSPPNVMIGFDGHVHLIDFGIAQATLSHRSQIGSIKGKIRYMSPEQVRGLAIDGRSDIFSLAVMMYQLLTGIEPFAAEGDFEQMERVREFEPAPASTFNPTLSAAMDRWLARGMAKDVNARFQTARDMIHALDQVAVRADIRLSPTPLSNYMKSAFAKDRKLLCRVAQEGVSGLKHTYGDQFTLLPYLPGEDGTILNESGEYDAPVLSQSGQGTGSFARSTPARAAVPGLTSPAGVGSLPKVGVMAGGAPAQAYQAPEPRRNESNSRHTPTMRMEEHDAPSSLAGPPQVAAAPYGPPAWTKFVLAGLILFIIMLLGAIVIKLTLA